MAGLNITAASGEMLSGVAAKTLVAIVAPANQRRRVRGFKVMTKGTNPNQAPIKCEFIIGITPNTLGGSGQLNLSAAVKQSSTDAETPQTQVYVNTGVSLTEPSGPIVTPFSDETPAAGGVWTKDWAPGAADAPLIGGNTSCGLRVTADTTTIVAGEIYLEE